MNTETRQPSKIATALVALAAWLGLGIQFYVTQINPNLSDVSQFERTLRFFEYFTITTNLIVAVSLTAALLLARNPIGRFFLRSSTMTATASYIVLVGLVYNFILASLHEFTGAAQAADFLTHDLVPLLYTGYWFLFVPKGKLNWKMPFVWLLYPAVYLIYALAKASFTGRYPYPFLDVGRIGGPMVLLNSIVLTFVFFIVGELFVLADKLISRWTPRHSQSPQLSRDADRAQ